MSRSDPSLVETVDGGESIVTASHRAGRKVPFLVVGGIDERDVFAYAPTMACDRVHWDTIDEFDARSLVDDLPMTAYTRQWSDGQHRIWVDAGRGFEAREAIKAWCVAKGVDVVNARVEVDVPFRDLRLIPDNMLPDLIAAAVDWLYPRSFTIRKKIVNDLDLIDDDDVRSLMYLFVSDHADRYDGGRQGRNGTLNFLAFLMGKLKTWPQDAARTAYGRAVVSDRIALTRAAERIATDEHRHASDSDLAVALGTSITDIRRREQAISALSSLRNPQALAAGGPDLDPFDSVQLVSDADVEGDALAYGRSAALAGAIMSAVNHPDSRSRRAQDPLGLAAVYLSFWEGLSRPDVARELGVLPKTANAAVARVVEQIHAADIL